MPKGGRRAGAGRKPGVKRAVVLGMDGARRPGFALPERPEGPIADPDGLLTPPEDLAEADRAVWLALAPHAIRERTLTRSKVPGFRQLCRQWVYCTELDARVRLLGITSSEADRLLRHLDKWEKALSASLGNFSVRSFGKPATAEKPKPAANPFGAFGQGAR